MPENCRHAGFACDGDDSLHLTIGFLSRFSQAKKALRKHVDSWIESEMSEGFADLALPNQLPGGPTVISKDELLLATNVFRDNLCARMDEDEDLHVEFTTVLNRIESPLSPDEVVQNMLRMEDHGPFTLLEPGQTSLHEDGGTIFDFASGMLTFKEKFREALDTLSQPRTFRAEDLPLDFSDAVALCRVLVGVAVLRPGQ